MRSMNVIHAEFAEGFDFGHDAVVMVMDTSGVKTFLAAVTQAEQRGSSRLVHGDTIHQFLIEPGAADIEFHDGSVVWRLDHAKAAEIIELLTEITESTNAAGHHYVDISTPAKTLVLSHNEYLDKISTNSGTLPTA
jgi:hypothetical protein